jgi:hypothetical protein
MIDDDVHNTQNNIIQTIENYLKENNDRPINEAIEGLTILFKDDNSQFTHELIEHIKTSLNGVDNSKEDEDNADNADNADDIDDTEDNIISNQSKKSVRFDPNISYYEYVDTLQDATNTKNTKIDSVMDLLSSEEQINVEIEKVMNDKIEEMINRRIGIIIPRMVSDITNRLQKNNKVQLQAKTTDNLININNKLTIDNEKLSEELNMLRSEILTIKNKLISIESAHAAQTQHINSLKIDISKMKLEKNNGMKNKLIGPF